MHIDVVIYIMVIEILAILSPGPDFFMVLKNSLTNSLRAGFFTTLGIALGGTLLFSFGIFGIGSIIASNKILFNLMRYIGALYLVYLGIRSIITKVKVTEPQLIIKKNLNRKEDIDFLKMGLICNLTNPKALMFIIALSTYIVEHANPYIDGVIIIIGSLVVTLIWFTLVSYIFGSSRVRKIFYTKQRIINIIFGIILLSVAINIIYV